MVERLDAPSGAGGITPSEEGGSTIDDAVSVADGVGRANIETVDDDDDANTEEGDGRGIAEADVDGGCIAADGDWRRIVEADDDGGGIDADADAR